MMGLPDGPKSFRIGLVVLIQGVEPKNHMYIQLFSLTQYCSYQLSDSMSQQIWLLC